MKDLDLEKRLNEAEEKYRALFEFGPIGVAYHQMIYDEYGKPFDYKFLEVNDNYFQFTGVNPSGKTVREAFPGIENDPFDWIGKFGEVAKNGKTFSCEQFLPLNKKWYNLVAYQYLPDHFVAAFLDITESKNAQIELKEVNAGMKSVLDASSRVSIIRTETNGIINLFSKGAEKILGYNSEEVIGKENPLLFHKESEVIERSIELTQKFGRAIKGFEIFKVLASEGEVDERDWTYITKDGSEKSVTLSITAICNSNNEITGFLGTAVDISDRKEMEKKLRDSENLFRSLFEESADAFLLIDNNEFIDCNHAAVKMFNAKDFNEIRAHHPSILSPENQPDGRKSLEKANEMIDFAFKNGTNRFEWDHQKVDGDIFPTEVLLTRVNIGKKTLLHTCIRDITDRKEAEEQLRQAQKMEVVGQLAGGVAHDFNNMLSGIIGATEILQMELKENSKYTQYTNIIINVAERAAELTQQLLAFGRKGKQTTKVIEINNIINNVKEMLKHTINKNIDIITELKDEKLSIKGDESQIQNAILNLCVNSRDAMPLGGKIYISSDIIISNGLIKDREGIEIPYGKYVQVKVKDTGSGIPESEINKIFEPFFTTKDIGHGTGLGLASVYGTIKSHNSFMQLTSIENKETTFTLLFPFFNSENDIGNDIKSEMKEKFQGKVLVIDDEQILRDTIKVMLESIGFNVILADNGLEGIKKYAKYHAEIDLVVLDIIMPQLSGRDCYEELKKINNKLKVIIVSGFIKNEEMSDILKDSNNNFLHKPFRKKELISVVNKILNL